MRHQYQQGDQDEQADDGQQHLEQEEEGLREQEEEARKEDEEEEEEEDKENSQPMPRVLALLSPNVPTLQQQQQQRGTSFSGGSCSKPLKTTKMSFCHQCVDLENVVRDAQVRRRQHTRKFTLIHTHTHTHTHTC